jgi:hypothetical protein
MNIQNIPNVNRFPLEHVFEVMALKQKPDTLWLEFGVTTGRTIQYISRFADKVYGFDSFLGNPEKWRDGFEAGVFSMGGATPGVNANVELVVGLFQDTLVSFLQSHPQKISFIHIDSDLYSSAKFVLNAVKDQLDTDCVIIFDELVNYPGFDVEAGELKAFSEFVADNNVSYDWIGMNGTIGMEGYVHENVAVMIHSVGAAVPAEAAVEAAEAPAEAAVEAAEVAPEAPAEAPAEVAAEAAPAEAAPAVEAAVEAPAVEAPAEAAVEAAEVAPEAPAEAPAEVAAEAAPAEAAPAVEAAVEAPAEAAPVEVAAEVAPAVEAPAEVAPAEVAAEVAPVEAPAEAAPAEAAPAEVAPVEAPAVEAPAEVAPVEAPAEAAPEASA